MTDFEDRVAELEVRVNALEDDLALLDDELLDHQLDVYGRLRDRGTPNQHEALVDELQYQNAALVELIRTISRVTHEYVKSQGVGERHLPKARSSKSIHNWIEDHQFTREDDG